MTQELLLIGLFILLSYCKPVQGSIHKKKDRDSPSYCNLENHIPQAKPGAVSK